MSTPDRILVYRLGSLGDTLVALPALRLVAEAFAGAEKWLLTNVSVTTKAAPAMEVLEGTGLIDHVIEYPLSLRNPRALLELRSKIKELGFRVAIYLAAPRGRMRAMRDALFFRWCGIERIVGVPYADDAQNVRAMSGGMYEHEAARIARCVNELGDVDLNDRRSFGLQLTVEEDSEARRILQEVGSDGPILAASIGAKVDVKDWGDENWSSLFERVSQSVGPWGIVMLGAADEHERSDRLLKYWSGRALNLCGRLRVRESAAILARCRLFVGHDSGPMHLSASVGTPVVAVFSSRNLPGQWFPLGVGHRVHYRRIDCQGCSLDVCVDRRKECIRSILVNSVVESVLSLAGYGSRTASVGEGHS